MDVTLSGMTIDVKDVQLQKALSPIELQESLIITVFNELGTKLIPANIYSKVQLLVLLPPTNGRVIVSKDVHPLKVPLPIETTLQGIMKDVKDVQLSKA